MTLDIKKPEPLKYTHVRVFKETHQQLLDIAEQEGASLPRVLEALVSYYLESQPEVVHERSVG